MAPKVLKKMTPQNQPPLKLSPKVAGVFPPHQKGPPLKNASFSNPNRKNFPPQNYIKGKNLNQIINCLFFL